jgi:dihydroorotate dehydrogenase
MNFYPLARRVMFLLPPEYAHNVALKALCCVPCFVPLKPSSALAIRVAGLDFSSPIGLAAGFDKNAVAVDGLLARGFGFVEIGTLTPLGQLGNPQPRVFRLQEKAAVINRLGFNNEGVHAAVARLKVRKHLGIVGGNIGKNKDSTNAIADYVACLYALYAQVDYITVNISSPNTQGLRGLQQADVLTPLVQAVHAARDALIQQGQKYKPVFVKISPDNSDAELADICDVAVREKLDGLIVSNTTISRDHVAHARFGNEAGGLSGAPLMARSTQVLKQVYVHTQGQVPLIGVGGVASAEDAYAKILAGASLVQLYTALIYQGMGLVRAIHRRLPELLMRDGFSSVQEAVGKGTI